MLSLNSFKSRKVSRGSFLSRYNNARGFTLIEVLVATVILASSLVLIVKSLAGTQQALRISQNLIFATEIGADKLSSLELDQQEKIRLTVQHDQGKENFLGKVFRWESDLSPYQDESVLDETKLNQVQVQVAWQDSKTRENHLQLNTLLLVKDQGKA